LPVISFLHIQSIPFHVYNVLFIFSCGNLIDKFLASLVTCWFLFLMLSVCGHCYPLLVTVKNLLVSGMKFPFFLGLECWLCNLRGDGWLRYYASNFFGQAQVNKHYPPQNYFGTIWQSNIETERILLDLLLAW